MANADHNYHTSILLDSLQLSATLEKVCFLLSKYNWPERYYPLLDQIPGIILCVIKAL